MASTARSTLGRRLGVLIAGAVALAALFAATVEAATPAPRGVQATGLRARTAVDTTPRTPAPGFLLHGSRYLRFDAPGARLGTMPYDVNDRGQIVGRYDNGTSEQAFLRDRSGRFTTIKIPGAQSAWAVGINNRSQIVGVYSQNTPLVKAPGAVTHGFLLDRGRLTRIDVPGAPSTGALGINDLGQVVGDYLDPDGSGTGHGFRWSKGRFVTIDPPGAATTAANGINNRGQIVGVSSSDLAAGTSRGFLLEMGRYTTIEAPGIPITYPVGINDRGQISGFTLTGLQEPLQGARGFVLANGVKGPFTPIDVPGAPKTLAAGLSNHGQIVGTYENPAATPSPQPAGRPPAGRVA